MYIFLLVLLVAKISTNDEVYYKECRNSADPTTTEGITESTTEGYFVIKPKILNKPSVNTTQCDDNMGEEYPVIRPKIVNRGTCPEATSYSEKDCGTRKNSSSNSNTIYSYEGEFPWICIILAKKDNYRFIGTCAIIPSKDGSDTNRVITAAHKLSIEEKHYTADELMIRVGDYHLNCFEHSEYDYNVKNIKKHPDFSKTRFLTNDIAILYTQKSIDLTKSNVNTVCLPSCKETFPQKGMKCWVAGWGRTDEEEATTHIQYKVDLPLVNDQTCQKHLKNAMNKEKPGAGNGFKLDQSEVCAGGEAGKDTCYGDGGSPLVCQANSGRWVAVGLTAWGVGCGHACVPGVYVNVSHFTQWINDN